MSEVVNDVEVVTGNGAVQRIPELVAGFAPRRVLVVASRAAVARTGIVARLDGYRPEVFADFAPNPQLADGLRGAAVAAAAQPDLILGLGGGSAMDVAKLVRGLPTDRDDATAVLRGAAQPQRRARLLLVPTVAGSGSEVTGFATVFVGGVKHSLDHPSVHADLAVVDPELTATCPPDVTSSGALDALAHAVESLWSLRSTALSRQLALDAMRALVGILGRPVSAESRVVLSAAATRAGLAIDRTRTTAAHAFAYPLTARLGIRHGLACALNLVWLLPFTAERLSTDCQDPRGTAFVGRRLAEISAVLGPDSGTRLAELVRAAGFSPALGDHGVTEADLPGLVDAALGHSRSTNGPVRLDPADVLSLLRKRLAG
ncbi:MAG: phosphonoacetaldehyde reductase [Actinobacteria bacterium]|nr:MAG: phosphonoacetaldehyde reductase [Actinomycetota bacterium]